MRTATPWLTSLAVLAVAVPCSPTPAAAQEDPELQEWEVPWAGSRPRDPYVGPDGKVWFVGQTDDYAAYLDPASGRFERFDLGAGVGPHNLIVGADGTVWYTGNRASHVGKLDPATGEIERLMMPDERARDPHTLVFAEDGSLWFTVQGGNMIGRLDPASGAVRLVEAPLVEGGRSPSSRPYGIKMDSQGRPWVALFNTNKIAMVDPETMELRSYDLPEGARPRRLEVTPDDQVWYVDYARGFLGRLDPESGSVEEWANPSGAQARPYGMASDPDGRIWFVETGVQPNQFVGFDPASEEYISVVPVESGGGSIRHMYYHAATNTVWFGTDANTVGKAVLPPLRRPVSE